MAEGGTRRHELDWLRVLLFGLLVPHHAAVPFSDFGRDIYGYANDALAGPGLTLAIYWSHCWRLPALFVVAGMGTWLATRRARDAGALGRRMARLLLPVAFGALLVNVAAGWALARALGEAGPLGGAVMEKGPRVMHLWFLVNLAAYTLLLWPVLGAVGRLARAVSAPRLLLVAGLAVAGTVAAAKPFGSAVAGDGYQAVWYLVVFASGVALGARHEAVLDWTARRAWWLLGAGVLTFLAEVSMLAAAGARSEALAVSFATGGWAADGVAPAFAPLPVAFALAEGANAWLWVLAALGLAARFLTRPGRWLPALTRATYPLYVLHFPVVIVGGALLTRTAWPWGLELLLLVAATYAITAMLWLGASRLGPAATLVGGRASPLNPAGPPPPSPSRRPSPR